MPREGALVPMMAVSACPHPFRQDRIWLSVPLGSTVADIVAAVQPDPLLRARVRVWIGAVEIPAKWWDRTRPRAGAPVTVRVLPAGGQGVGRIAALVGLAVLTVVVSVVTYGAATPALGAVWAGGLSAVAAAAVGIGGQYLINTYLPPPVPGTDIVEPTTERATYSIEGARNRLNQWGPVPQLFGRFRIVPPYAVSPLREPDGERFYWRAVFALSLGPVELERIRIGETDIERFDGVRTEFRRGYYKSQRNNRGDWSPLSGDWPASPAFGDTWDVVAAGSHDGVRFKPGDTITFNALYARTNKLAWDVNQFTKLKLFTRDAFEDAVGALLAKDAPVVRTSQENAEWLRVTLQLPRGLYFIENNPPGARGTSQVHVKIEQRLSGTTDWDLVTTKTIRDRTTNPLYWTHDWELDEPGTYDVRVTRTDPEMDPGKGADQTVWDSLTTLASVDNLFPMYGVALLAVRIKASGQLSGALDELNVTARSIVPDWDAAEGTWITRPTSNPASLYRSVLQHPLLPEPLEDAGIDLARLQDWHEWCDEKSLTFDAVWDRDSTVFDLLEAIGRCGEASPAMRNTQRSVVVDRPLAAPVRVFSPRNTNQFSLETTFLEPPHALRIAYASEKNDYKIDELVVFDDGYQDSNASIYERADLVGVVGEAQAYRMGRRLLAERRLRRETFTFSTDFEMLACERGDLVAIQHDGIAVGIGAARIKGYVTNVGGDTTAIVIDSLHPTNDGWDSIEDVDAVDNVDEILIPSQQYALVAYHVAGGVQRRDSFLVSPANSTTLELVEPVRAGGDLPAVGSACVIGVPGRETINAIVRDIQPGPELTARMVCISEGAGVHEAADAEIPEFDAGVTAPRALLAPVVRSVVTDETALGLRPDRTLSVRAIFDVDPPSVSGALLRIYQRLTDSDREWSESSIASRGERTAIVDGLREGESYDFRLQYVHEGRLFASPISLVSGVTIVGRTSAPRPIAGLNIAAVGGNALLRWDLPADIDVQYGGMVRFRHSSADVPGWQQSTSIGEAVNGAVTFAYLPLKPGRYYAEVYDALGRPSGTPASVDARQASLLEFVTVGSVVEHPTFGGDLDNLTAFSGGVRLDAESFDDVVDVDAIDDVDSIGSSVTAIGTYTFSAGLDLLTVKRVRLTGLLKVSIYDTSGLWDSRTDLIDSWSDIDGAAGVAADAVLYERHTDDDPAGSPTWSGWARLDSHEVEGRAMQFKVVVTSEDPSYNIDVTAAAVTVEGVA